MPLYIQAGLWGLLAGSSLIIGAAIAYFYAMSARMIAGIMALGSGVLTSAVAFDLMDEAYETGGFDSTSIGFLAGALIYTLANILITRNGAQHRKRSGHQAGDERQSDSPEAGLAIAIGALIDGIPESIVIGISLISGEGVSMVMVVAVFLSNVPEALSSSAGMLRARRSPRYIFSVWTGIAVASSIAAVIGNLAMANASADAIAFTIAIAAGGILAMLVDTMIPEAYETAHEYAGLITVIGFLAAFTLSKLGG
jgi:ZIP family zinc transporter